MASLLIAFSMVLGGCEGAPKAARLDSAIGSYERGDLDVGFEQATEIMDATRGADREQAAYVAALCAYGMGDLDEAELRLRILQDASDPALAARAEASLGLVRMRQGRYGEAATHFDTAESGLEGDDARQARDFGHLARHYAVTGRTDWSPRSQPLAATNGNFTLQAGAFRERSRADVVARQYQTIANREGLGSVRVVKSRERRETLYLVQMGRFQTRQEAARLRGQIGRLDLIVASTG
jgi:tetratricopeptide (TPR) repeat protein